MAENKKSFVAYCDWGEIFDDLTNEEAGKLVKHLFDYVRDENPESDKLTNLLFIQIKQSLKRDLKKYEKYVYKQRVNGSKGGRPKKPKETQKTQVFISKPKKADSVNVSVSDNVNVIDSVNDINKKTLFLKWLAYRKEIKKPIKVQSTLQGLTKKFNEKSLEELTFVINASIENGWQGLIWEKYDSKKQDLSFSEQVMGKEKHDAILAELTKTPQDATKGIE